MCLILFAYRPHPERLLVLAANRDEAYARPALAAHWWQQGGDGCADIFGGRDLQAGGTWLAASTDGRLAAVTNCAADTNAARPPGSRGDLPRRFLEGRMPSRHFAATIDGALYAGFNFIGFDGEELTYASNRTGEVRHLQPGVYGLANARLGAGLAIGGAVSGAGEGSSGNLQRHAGDDWPKAAIGATALQKIAAQASTDDLLDLLSRPLLPPATPNGRGCSPEHRCSPCFIKGSNYGTRASTAIVVGREALEFVEQLYGPFGKPGKRTRMRVALATRHVKQAAPSRSRRQDRPRQRLDTASARKRGR